MENQVTEDIQLGKCKPKNESWPSLGMSLREDIIFYIVSVTLVFLISAFYLLSEYSGGKWAWVGLPLDDNWIHLVYARSLAEDGWFYYNSNVPEAGMSSPLWVILLALVYKLFTPLNVTPQWCAKGLSLLFGILLPILVYHLARNLKLERRWAWFAGILVILEPNLAYGNVAGMEVGMFSFLTLLALLFTWQRRYMLAGFVLGLVVLTRGEGALTVAVVGLMPLVSLFKEELNIEELAQKALKLAVMLFAPSLLLGGLWAIYNYSVNGHFLPNSYYVKHNFLLGYFNLQNMKNVLFGYIAHLSLFKGYVLPFVALALIAAIFALYRNKQMETGLPLIIIPLAQLYAFSINIKVVTLETPWTYFTRRYMDFLIPLFILFLAIGIAFLWKRASQSRTKFVIVSTLLITFGTILTVSINSFLLNRYFIEEYSWNTENIEQVEVAMAKWVRDNIPANESIAVTDAGAIRFWARPDQQILDFLGLNSNRCIGRPSAELMNEFKPNYIVFFRQAVTDSTLYEELNSVKVKRNSVLGGNELVALKVKKLPPWP